MRRLIRLAAVTLPLAAAGVVAGCEGWISTAGINSAAWSDDDTEIAFVLSRVQYRSLPLFGGTQYRNFRQQLYVRSPSGHDSVTLGAEVTGDLVLGTLRDMKKRGYLTLTVTDDGRDIFYQIMRDGSRREVARVSVFPRTSCQPYFPRVIPSPGGEYLALVTPGICDTTSILPSAQVTVRFIDAMSLAPIRSDTIQTNDRDVSSTWLPDGTFDVGTSTGVWSLAVDRPAAATTAPHCWTPQTTSSEWSSLGARVGPGGRTVTIGHPAQPLAFGCQ
jgi:hypothetical protein